MTGLSLLWSNLMRKPTRTGLTIATLVVAFLLFMLLRALAATGLLWALLPGFVGGLMPAMRAARLPLTEALRGE